MAEIHSGWVAEQRTDDQTVGGDPFENMKMCTKTSLLRRRSEIASASVRRQRYLVHFRGVERGREGINNSNCTA